MLIGLVIFLIFFSHARSSPPCPEGYAQAPNGGNCFMAHTFFDDFNGFFLPKSFNDAEQYCNSYLGAGGMLASFHSEEEVEFAQTQGIASCKPSSGGSTNMGLRCTGTNCRWDDGSAVTYLNFPFGGPPDDSNTRCYSYGWKCKLDFCKSTWLERGCGPQEADCWICSVKARTIECSQGEMEYKGGCISIHSTPLDEKTAEESCPDGGKLISIHSSSENKFYLSLALNAGFNGSLYIGGRFTNGVFGWTDGTFYDVNTWAPSFPNTIFGSCTQMLLASEFGNQGQKTNIDCNTKQPFMCFRDGANYGPTSAPQPLADAHCPPIQYYTGTGNIISPNFPLSIPAKQTCEYVIGTEEGTRASIQFSAYNCKSGTSLEFYDGLDSYQPFLTHCWQMNNDSYVALSWLPNGFTTKPPALGQPYTSSSNVMKIIFTANGTAAPTGTGWEAEFRGV